MRKFTILFLLLCLPFIHVAQTLNGKVYDASGTVKNVKVFNKTQNRVTVTNNNGNFSLEAKVADTISIESVFYHPKIIALQAYHFDGTAVFEIKEILTELDEVEVKAAPEELVFVEETYNAQLKNMIQEDIKNHPEKYKPAASTYGPGYYQ